MFVIVFIHVSRNVCSGNTSMQYEDDKYEDMLNIKSLSSIFHFKLTSPFHFHQTIRYAIFQLTRKKPCIDDSDLRYLMQRSLRKLKLEIVLASIRPEPKRCRNDVENEWQLQVSLDMIQATTHSWFVGLQPSI